MTGYSMNFKMKIITEYLGGTGSTSLCYKYHIPSKKTALNWVHHYQTREELETAMRDWIKYYNESRIKEKLGGRSPIEYRISTTEQVA